jgi:hypothetical protein
MPYLTIFKEVTPEEVAKFWEPYLAKANANGGRTLINEAGREMDVAEITRNYNEDLANANKAKGASSAGNSSSSSSSGGKSGGGGGGGGGTSAPKGSGGTASSGSGKSAKKAPEPATPPAPPVMTSFGKLFCAFCLPSLLASAAQEDIDEVQVNFYQMNESCGPVSLHSVAEFPILVSELKDEFSRVASQRGGESMTVFEFMDFVNTNIFNQKRAPGYGMRSFNDPQDDNKPADAKKDDAADQAKSNKMTEWTAKYGEFKQPNITMKIDTMYEGDDGGGVDLLYKLQHTVGARYNAPPPDFETDPAKKKKRIKRVDIFDSTYDPYAKTNKVFKDSDGSYRAFETTTTDQQRKDFTEAYARDYSGPGGVEGAVKNNRVTINGVTVGPPIVGNKDVLKNYVGDTVPKIEVGTNATMVMNASVQSKMDGLAAAAAAYGGLFKNSSTLSPSGLSSAENNLPVKVLPAELSLTSMGMPLAEAFQEYFIDFNTATTIDNLYRITQIQHNFAPGKFESTWTFVFTDGYSKFFGAAPIGDSLKEMKKDKEDEDGEKIEPVPEPPEPAAPGKSGTAGKKK